MRTVLGCLAVAGLMFATGAQAQSYGQITGGGSFGGASDFFASFDDGTGPETFGTDIDLDSGYFASASLGRYVGAVRIEAELLLADNDLNDFEFDDGTIEIYLDDVSLRQVTAMVNVQYDFQTDSAWTPYVGAGVGYGEIRFKDNEADPDDALDETDNGVAWQLKVGVAYSLSERAWIDVGYRYLAAPDFSYSQTDAGETFSLDIESHTHAVTVGLRYAF